MLAEMVMADAPFRIDEIGSWPIFVTERLPDRVTIVDDDGIVDFQTSDGLAHIADIPFEREFRRVYTDDDKAAIPVFLSPGPDIGQRMQAIDTIEGPEIDQHHLAAQSLRRQRWRIQPFGTARKARQCAFTGRSTFVPAAIFVTRSTSGGTTEGSVKTTSINASESMRGAGGKTQFCRP